MRQERHDRTAECLRTHAGRLGFSSSREGSYMRRGSRTSNRPQARWDLHCHIRPGAGHILVDVSYINPLAASYVRRSARQAGSAAQVRDAEKLRDYLHDHNCPGHTFRAVSFELHGRYSRGAMQFITEVAHAAFPGAHSGWLRSRALANVYSQLAVIRCQYNSRMLTAAAGLNTAHTGTSWIRGGAVPEADLYE